MFIKCEQKNINKKTKFQDCQNLEITFGFWAVHFETLLIVFFYRHQEDGVQNTSVAREVLFVLCMQNGNRHQVVYSA